MGIASFSGASSVIKPGVVTSSTRPSSPFVGQLIYDTTLSQVLAWNGSAWIVQSGGMVLVKAETAFTAQSSFNVANIFTSAYTNYFVTFRFTASTAGGGISVQLSSNGTAASTNYNYMRIIAYGTSSLISARSSAQSSFAVIQQVGGVTGMQNFAQLTLSGPQLAEPTLLATGNNALTDGATYASADNESHTGNHSTATSYDGLTILAISGAITGTYAVYGYTK